MKKTRIIQLFGVALLISVMGIQQKANDYNVNPFEISEAGSKDGVKIKKSNKSNQLPMFKYSGKHNQYVSNAQAQLCVNNDNTFSIRFVSAIKANINSLDDVSFNGIHGFHIKYEKEGTTHNFLYDVNYAYLSLVTGSDTYYANELSSYYNSDNKSMLDWVNNSKANLSSTSYNLFTVATINNIPANAKDTTFTVQPYVKVEDEILLSSSYKTVSVASLEDEKDIVVLDDEEKDEMFVMDQPDFTTRKITTKDDVQFDDLFNLGNKVDVKVYVSDSELNLLANDHKTGYKNQTYHRADKVVISLKNYDNTFTWEYENVGLRQKGNTSRQDIFNSSGGLNLNHFKLSFDETFDDPELYSQSYINQYGNEAYGDREFLNSLSGLDFKWNKNYDQTHIKEIYSSYLYQANGIISQHIGLSNFTIVQVDKGNKETSMGLCMLYEPASKSLIKRSLQNENKTYLNMGTWKEEKKGTFGVPDENYGDYYECGYGVGSGNSSRGSDMSLDSISGSKIGVGNNSGSYIPAYERKTNKDAVYNDDLLRKFIATINNGAYEEIENVIDIDEFAKQEAITYYIGNPDGLRYNYNNYCVYIRRTDGKLIVIPIDNDRCFGITKDWNVRNALKDEAVFSLNDSNGAQRNNLLLKTILSEDNNRAKEVYKNMCLALRNSSWGKSSTFTSLFNIAKATYNEHSFSLTDSNISFDTYINSKNAAIDASINDEIVNETVKYYFECSLNWSNVYFYAYGDNGDFSTWPGTKMNFVGTRNGNKVYSCEFNPSLYNKVIFGNGSSGEYNQTEGYDVSNLSEEGIFTLGSLSDRNRYNVVYNAFDLNELD